jgi:hypothetical protein
MKTYYTVAFFEAAVEGTNQDYPRKKDAQKAARQFLRDRAGRRGWRRERYISALGKECFRASHPTQATIFATIETRRTWA